MGGLRAGGETGGEYNPGACLLACRLFGEPGEAAVPRFCDITRGGVLGLTCAGVCPGEGGRRGTRLDLGGGILVG